MRPIDVALYFFAAAASGVGSAPLVPPTFASITPDLADTAGGGGPVTVVGTDLRTGGPYGTLAIVFDGVPGTIVEIVDPETVLVIPPAHAAGTANVVVTNALGTTAPLPFEWWAPGQLANARIYRSNAGVSAPGGDVTRYRWTWTSDNGPFPFCDGVGVLGLSTKIVAMGGSLGGGSPTYNVINETVDGVTVTELLPNDTDPPVSGPGARWRPRHVPGGWLEYDDGVATTPMVIGGDHFDAAYFNDVDFPGAGGYACDVWRGSPDASTWTRQGLFPAGLRDRMLHTTGQHTTGDNKIYLFGGQNGLLGETTVTLHNDLWVSADAGASWTQIRPDAPASATNPAPRGLVDRLVSFAGDLWLICGGTYDDPDELPVPAPRIYYKEVWSYHVETDTWTQHADFPGDAREYHLVRVFDGKIFVGSGYNGSVSTPEGYLNRNDWWMSADGDTWTQVPGFPANTLGVHAPWAPGHADGACVFGGKLWHFTGNALDGEIYYSTPVTGPLVTGILDQGVNAKDVSQATALKQPILEPDAYFTVPGVVYTGGEHLDLAAQDVGFGAGGYTDFAVLRAPIGSYVRAPTDNYPGVLPFNCIAGEYLAATVSNWGLTAGDVETYNLNAAGLAWDKTSRPFTANDGQTHVVGFFQDAGGVTCYGDGVQLGATDVVPHYSAAFSGWDAIGVGFSESGWMRSTFFARVVVPGAVSGADRARLQKWAAQQFGAPA